MPLGHFLSLADPEGIDLLKRTLSEGGYSADGIRAALGIGPHETIPSSEIAASLAALPPDAPLTAFITLFNFGRPIAADVAARAFSIPGVDRLQAMGILQAGPQGVTPLVRFQAYGGFLFASDRRVDNFALAPADYVLEVNPTSEHLAIVTPRRHVKSTLDIGCGGGVLSVLAATHSERVTGTDINPRALNFAAFNDRLNGRSNIERLQGSMLEPVVGRTFDLIFSNPPFVVSPDSDLQFRDGGRPLDTFCQELVNRVPAHLEEGGVAIVLCNWVIRKGEKWTDRLAGWFADGGCDAVLFKTQWQTAAEYAGTWNQVLAATDPRAYEAALRRWNDYYREQGLERIEGGRIVLRRRQAARNWTYSLDGAFTRKEGSGDQLLRIIEAQDFLRSEAASERLLDSAFYPSPDFRLDQNLAFRDGRMVPINLAASQAGGFQLKADLDPVTWRLLAGLDGRRTIRELLETAARESGTALPAVASRTLPAITGLYGNGFLVRSKTS